MTRKNFRKFRCKNSFGYSCRWTVAIADGVAKIVSMGSMKAGKTHVPLSFAPFELSNAVYNSPDFNSLDAAESYVRGL